MPKKTTQTKKKAPVAVVDTHKSYNLQAYSETEAQEIVQHLTIMKATQGWQIMVQILEGNMHVLEQSILLKVDFQTGELLEEVQVDELREKLKFLRELVRKPDELIRNFTPETEQDLQSLYDPYYLAKKVAP